jgi:cell division protease FtsH
MMGGRVAEEFKFGKENITSGASSDIEQATKLARAMVTRWGFSDKLGHVAYGDNQEEVFLGHSVARTQNVSEETAQIIDAEVRRLIDEAYSTAKQVLTKKKKDWIALAEGLLEYETLSGDEIKQLIAGNKPARDMGDDTPPSRGSAVPARGAARRRARSLKADWNRSRRGRLFPRPGRPHHCFAQKRCGLARSVFDLEAR